MSPGGGKPRSRAAARPVAPDAPAALDRNGVRQGALRSTAYMFGVPDVDFEDEIARTRAENDYVSDQVARLEEVFRLAEERGKALVVHMAGRSDYDDATDAVPLDVSVATYPTVLPLTPQELADITDNRVPYLS